MAREGYAVACGHRVTAEAAAAVLEEGGSAMDGAVAGALAAMVAEPVLAGLLGGGFALVRRPGGEARVLDFFAQTPRERRAMGEVDLREIHADFGTATQAFHIGPGSIAVPGAAPGLAEAHARFGRLPLRTVAAPAVQAAREGVALNRFQARLARVVGPILTASAAARALHGDGAAADGLKAEGARLANPDLADVLEEYAAEGPRFVTEGEVAAALVSLTEAGGHLARADLKGYAPHWRAPLKAKRGAARAALNPEPALGGALVAFLLAVLPEAPRPPDIVRALSEIDEARRAARLGTPGGHGRLLADDRLDAARARLDRAAGRPAATRGTTHLSVIDGEGLGVAITLSNGEGCGLIAPGTGIMPNNFLGESDLVPGGDLERWPTDRRLASMMCPTALDWEDGRTALLGSGGSSRIPGALAQVVAALVDRGAGPEEAVAAPRVHVTPEDGAHRVEAEAEGLAPADREALLAAFPEARLWGEPSMFFGGVHLAARTPSGNLSAAGDPRRDGHALVVQPRR